MVFVDRAPRGLSGVYVIEDDLGGAREAVTHLARHGHRRVAFFGVSTPVTTTHRRLRGYRSAVAENGLADRPDLVCMPFESPEESAAELVKRLAAPDPPTAVFSSNIPCTMALVLALHQAGRTDVAVVGFGDIPMAEALAPAVTVLDQDPAGTRAHRRGTAAPAHRRPARTAATQDRAPGPADPERIGRAASASRVTRKDTTMSEPGTARMAPRRGEPADLLRPGGRAARRRFRLAGRRRRHRPGAAPPAVHQRAHDVRVRAGAPGRRGRRGCPGGRPDSAPWPTATPTARTAAGSPASTPPGTSSIPPRRTTPTPTSCWPPPARWRPASRGRGRPGGRRGRHRPAFLVRRRRPRAGKLER